MHGDQLKQMMETFGLPGGLLPDGAELIHHDPPTERFEVRLAASMERRVGGYRVRYDKTLSGRIRHGCLDDLRGVSARGPLMWFRVRRIEARATDLQFSVGPVTKQIPKAAFS